MIKFDHEVNNVLAVNLARLVSDMSYFNYSLLLIYTKKITSVVLSLQCKDLMQLCVLLCCENNNLNIFHHAAALVF